MKRFKFRLSRVLDFRREQAELERSRLQDLLTQIQTIDDEKTSLIAQVSDAREQISRSVSVLGEELSALCGFERHIRNQTVRLDQARHETQQRIGQQQAVVLEAEKKVTLLLKLRQRQLSAWTVEEQKQLETLAAESYLSRLCAGRRERSRLLVDDNAVIKR